MPSPSPHSSSRRGKHACIAALTRGGRDCRHTTGKEQTLAHVIPTARADQQENGAMAAVACGSLFIITVASPSAERQRQQPGRNHPPDMMVYFDFNFHFHSSKQPPINAGNFRHCRRYSRRWLHASHRSWRDARPPPWTFCSAAVRDVTRTSTEYKEDRVNRPPAKSSVGNVVLAC
jgi:hypothetical protein